MSRASGPKCALVTGATGFVGSRLTYRLVREGWKVHVVVRPGSDLRELNPILPGIEIAKFEDASQQLNDIVAEASPDIVFHLASKFVAEHRSDQVPDLIDSNIRFGTQLLQAMVENHVFRLVNAGTSWQHFGTSDYRPVCLYAATKQAFEAILDFYIDAHLLRAVTLKLFDTYGPNDPRPKLLSALRAASQNVNRVAFSGGEQLLDLVYIDDVVDAFILAGERMLNGDGDPKEEYAVSSGAPLSLQELAKMYGSVLGVKLNLAWGSRPYRSREVMIPWCTGRPVPGWSPKISLREGIIRTENSRSNSGSDE